MLLSRVFRVVAWAGVCVLAGCAVGDPGEAPCTSDLDCQSGERCDGVELICVAAMIGTNMDPNNRVVPNSNPNNNPNTNNNTNNTPSNNTTNPPNNTPSNNTTNPPNNATTTNTTNTTNPGACMPACVAPETCVGGMCVLPDCAAVGDSCDPAVTSQNGFTCVDLDGDGLCLEPCGRGGSISNCGIGEYCLALGGNDVCLPSFCDTNADCVDGTFTGTCIKIDNGFNYCKEAGSAPSLGVCDPADDQCPIGEACDPVTELCEPMCDPYAPTCGSGHYCAFLLSPETGICTHDVVTGAPSSPFELCSPSGSVCDDATECWQISTTESACLVYCRPGMDDCSGVLTGGLNPTVCDPYALYQPGTGLCWPACSGASCGAGFVCDAAGLCRTPCTAATVVADCCGGQTPCPAYCNPIDNFCE